MPEQGSHHFVLTVQKPQTGSYAVGTWHGDITPAPGATRRDSYELLREEHARRYPDLAGGIVLHFSLESNQL